MWHCHGLEPVNHRKRLLRIIISKMKIRITALDKKFSLYIRERANWSCERCFKVYRPPTKALQCSHFHGRRKKSTRFDPDNCSALCMHCHQYFGENPIEHVAFMRNKLGERRFNLLTLRANAPIKVDYKMVGMFLDQVGGKP